MAPTELIPNEFVTSAIDNRIRPYTSGMRPHQESVATILLFTSDESNVKGVENVQANRDYLADLSTSVEGLVSEASKIGDVNPVVPNGKIPILTLDGTRDYYGVFNNFSLLKVAEDKSQIVKIHQHFGGEWNAFFFGSKPEMYRFDGFFIDSEEYPYYQEFMVAYEKYLAGRKCVENKMQMKIVYDGRIVDGYMLNIMTSTAAATPYMKQFTFTILVRSANWIRTNLIQRYNPGFGATVQEEGFNIMSNVERLRGLRREQANQSLEDDTTGQVSRAIQ